MEFVYAQLIIKGKKTLDQVPTKDPELKDKVIAVLRQYVEDGRITAEEFEEYTGLTYEVETEA